MAPSVIEKYLQRFLRQIQLSNDAIKKIFVKIKLIYGMGGIINTCSTSGWCTVFSYLFWSYLPFLLFLFYPSILINRHLSVPICISIHPILSLRIYLSNKCFSTFKILSISQSTEVFLKLLFQFLSIKFCSNLSFTLSIYKPKSVWNSFLLFTSIHSYKSDPFLSSNPCPLLYLLFPISCRK